MGTVTKLKPLTECDDLYANMVAAAAYYMETLKAIAYINDAHRYLESEISQECWYKLVLRRMVNFDPERYLFEQINFAGVVRKVVHLRKAKREDLVIGKVPESQL